METMKKLIPLLLLAFCALGATAQETRTVFGKVTDGKNPIENVNITVLDSDRATATDTDGRYEIAVETGDKVRYSYTGLRTIEIRIEDVTRVLNPIMIPEVNELDEVKVTASKRRSQKDLKEDYSSNKRIIKTAYGFLDADRTPGRIGFMHEEEINPINLCILDLLRGQFADLVISGDCSSGGVAISMRASGSLGNASKVIYDIDGLITEDAPIWLDVNNIKRIAYLNRLALAVPYGHIGSGGIIVINTKTSFDKKEALVDKARLKNNYSDGSELSRQEVAKNAPGYLKELRSSGSFEESKKIFERYHATYSNSPYFLLDAYTHFVEEHDEMLYADGIIDEHFGRYANNPVLLKSLAYIYESQGRYEKASETYKEVFILRPNYVQSYRDMAKSYRDLDEPRQAATMYARYEYLIDEGFLEQDTIGFGPIMNREFNNLLLLEKGTLVEGMKAQKLFVAEEDFKGTRLVFEWSDGEAEFELQFVNPEKQYHKWKHSMLDNAEEIEREKDFGYNVKEYLVDGSLPGTWQVNVNYLGNKSLTPAYLKATVYYGYGTRAQRKETMVFKLDLKNVNQELFQFLSSAKVVVK